MKTLPKLFYTLPFLVLALSFNRCRQDPEVTIQNPDSLPGLVQLQDFKNDYTGKDSDVDNPGPPLQQFKYDELDDDIAVGIPVIGGDITRKRNFWAFGFDRLPNGTISLVGPDPTNPADPVRAFHGKPGNAGDSKDWDQITRGEYHAHPRPEPWSSRTSPEKKENRICFRDWRLEMPARSN